MLWSVIIGPMNLVRWFDPWSHGSMCLVRKSWWRECEAKAALHVAQEKTDRRGIAVGGWARNSPKEMAMMKLFFPAGPASTFHHLPTRQFTNSSRDHLNQIEPSWPVSTSQTHASQIPQEFLLSTKLTIKTKHHTFMLPSTAFKKGGKKTCFWSTEHESWRRKTSHTFFGSAQNQLLATKQRQTYPELHLPKIPSKGNWYREVVEIDAEGEKLCRLVNELE